jgi:hypothetical protein
MARTAKFTVTQPACQPSPPGGPVPDATPVYMGTAPNDMMFISAFGPAIVTGGAKIGNKWVGCSYTAPPYVIPGRGDVELI